MQLEAIGYDDVTLSLQSFSEGLRPLLKKLKLMPIRITPDGEVLDPVVFGADESAIAA